MFDEKSYSLKMDKAIEVFSKELSSLRTGRANASMLDLIKVDVYGQQMPINQVGSITTPEPRMINIQVWDANNVSLVDAAIQKSTTIFHIGSLSLIEGEDASLWESKFQALNHQGVITSLDPNARPVAVNNKAPYIERLKSMLQQTCVLKLSDEDLEYLVPDTPLQDAFAQLCATSCAQLLILTKGSDGAIVRTPSQQFEVSAVEADPLRDTVGAGDTFMGTILVELYRRSLNAQDIAHLPLKELQKILERAATAAAINCQSSGCADINTDTG